MVMAGCGLVVERSSFGAGFAGQQTRFPKILFGLFSMI